MCYILIELDSVFYDLWIEFFFQEGEYINRFVYFKEVYFYYNYLNLYFNIKLF